MYSAWANGVEYERHASAAGGLTNGRAIFEAKGGRVRIASNMPS